MNNLLFRGYNPDNGKAGVWNGTENKPHWQEVMEQMNRPEQWIKKSPEQQANERLKFEVAEELGLLFKS